MDEFLASSLWLKENLIKIIKIDGECEFINF